MFNDFWGYYSDGQLCTVLVLFIYLAGRCHHHRIGSAWIEQTHKKLDIVIVTSLNAELLPGDTLAGTIYDMMHSIEVYLKQHSGVHNVRVGLLAYGGNGYLDKPHVYTVQG